MIISASRRTDIPAFYSRWFINRLEEGFCYVQNPMNRKQVRSIALTPESVDCFVFWTRNGTPLLPYVERLELYPYYFQWTLTAYEKEVEPHLPPLQKRIEQFKRVADSVGPERMVWRYDPIFISEKYSIQWHQEQLFFIGSALSGYTKELIFSFFDPYKKCEKAMQSLGYQPETESDIKKLAIGINHTTQATSIKASTCAETADLSLYNIQHGACIDTERMTKLTGLTYRILKDKNQRQECNCVRSIDIGSYHSCPHLCRYCYANSSESRVRANVQKHNPDSLLLIGELQGDESIREIL